MEAIRVQLETMSRFADEDELTEAIATLQGQLVDLQSTMVDLRLTGQGQDGVRFGARLLQKLGYLTGAIAGADFRPTDQEMQVKVILQEELRAHLEGAGRAGRRRGGRRSTRCCGRAGC